MEGMSIGTMTQGCSLWKRGQGKIQIPKRMGNQKNTQAKNTQAWEIRKGIRDSDIRVVQAWGRKKKRREEEEERKRMKRLPTGQQIHEMKLCLANKQQSMQQERRSQPCKQGCSDRKCRIISRAYWLLSHCGTRDLRSGGGSSHPDGGSRLAAASRRVGRWVSSAANVRQSGRSNQSR